VKEHAYYPGNSLWTKCGRPIPRERNGFAREGEDICGACRRVSMADAMRWQRETHDERAAILRTAARRA